MRFKLSLSLLTILLAACAPVTASPTSTPTARPSFTPIPTFTATSESPTQPSLKIPGDEPGTIVMDFVTRACEAQWSNNTYYIPCPGDRNDILRGYIEINNYTMLEGGLFVNSPLLIGLPGQGGENGSGLFGHYPPITVQAGDQFKTTIACQGDAPCDVAFALEYFDSSGNYHAETHWEWQHRAGDGPLNIDLDLSPLTEQTVDFMLVLRGNSAPQNNWVVWVRPRITREPFAQPNRPVPPETPTSAP